LNFLRAPDSQKAHELAPKRWCIFLTFCVEITPKLKFKFDGVQNAQLVLITNEFEERASVDQSLSFLFG
jgi:hypothetical protein